MTELREEENQTLYIGNLDSKVTEEILYELFLQAGPIRSLTIPKDKATKKSRSFGFVSFKEEVSMPYAYYLFRDLPLYGRPLKVEPRNKSFTIPPVYSVGVHTLEPKEGRDNESQEANVGDFPAQVQFSPYSSQQHPNNSVGQSPNPLLTNLPSLCYTPNNNVNAIDTNSMKNFKNFYENSNQHHQFNDSYDRDRSYSGGRFSGDKNSSPRFSGRLEFPNNGRNNDSPYNNRNHSPVSNSNSPHQGHANSSHRNPYNRNNNSPRNNFNNSYNDRNCNSPQNSNYNRNFNNNRNNTPFNNRGRPYGSGKRDSYGNDDRRDQSRSRDGGGGSGYHNRSYHNDGNQRRF